MKMVFAKLHFQLLGFGRFGRAICRPNRGGLDLLELLSARFLICNRLVDYAVPHRRWPFVRSLRLTSNGYRLLPLLQANGIRLVVMVDRFVDSVSLIGRFATPSEQTDGCGFQMCSREAECADSKCRAKRAVSEGCERSGRRLEIKWQTKFIGKEQNWNREKLKRVGDRWLENRSTARPVSSKVAESVTRCSGRVPASIAAGD